MALWSVKTEPEPRTGLTVYQLQELIRTGQVGADTQVSEDGSTWLPVVDVPVLAKALPDEAEKARAAEEAKTVEIHGVVLQRGPDGKPLPPSPSAVMQMLSGDRAPGQAEKEAAKRFNRLTLIVTSVLIVLLLLVLGRQFAIAHALLR